MGIFGTPSMSVPPPPPLPPAAPPPTIASSQVQAVGQAARSRAALAAGAGFEGTDLTGAGGVSSTAGAKTQLLGGGS